MSAHKHPATFAVHTVNGTTYACLNHTKSLVAVFGMLGAPPFPVPVDEEDGHSCANCVNEAKLRETK